MPRTSFWLGLCRHMEMRPLAVPPHNVYNIKVAGMTGTLSKELKGLLAT